MRRPSAPNLLKIIDPLASHIFGNRSFVLESIDGQKGVFANLLVRGKLDKGLRIDVQGTLKLCLAAKGLSTFRRSICPWAKTVSGPLCLR